ncbi:MAG: hypothetical protein RLY93_18305 [Sumerlaeia bacterium]
MRTLRLTKRDRATSLLELIFYATISLFITVFLMFVLIAMARQSRSSISVLQADGNAYRLINRIRTEMLPANFQSADITDGGNVITFWNPVRGYRASIYYDEEQQATFFDPDITASGDERVWMHNGRVVFRPTGDSKRFEVEVFRNALDRRNQPIEVRYRDVLTLRN